MAAPSFDAILGGLTSKGIDTLKATLTTAWDALTDLERTQCAQLLFTLAKARLYEIAGYDVKEFLPVLEAALLQWQVVGKQVVVDGIKSAATEAFGLGGAFAGSALAAFLRSR